MAIIRMMKKYTPRAIINIAKRVLAIVDWDQWFNKSWSQEGEDLVLRRIFEGQDKGFYVDIGAHHPMRFSNTYFFYRKGWSGINVDAMPGSMKSFKEIRPRDINLEVGVAQEHGSLDYYVFNEPALNGFSANLSLERSQAENPYFIKKVIKVDVKPLSWILDHHLSGRDIDFLTVDVEGLDLEVLRSNDWARYRPKYVLAEVLNSSLDMLMHDSLVMFMKAQGYDVYAKQVNTVFFKNVEL